MGLHLHSRFSAALGHQRFSALASAAIILSCAALGATLGTVFPPRTKVPAVSHSKAHGEPEMAPTGTLRSSAPQASLVAEAVKTTSEPESSASPVPASVIPASVAPTRNARAVGKSPPIETDRPCRWSQSADGTLTCTGRQVMLPGARDALHVRQCGMVFHDKVRFSGIEMQVVSKQAKGNPFLVRSPDDWKMNFDAPNATAIRVIFTADTPEPGNVVCQFSYHLQRVP
jgi:hypothetical protein